MTSSVLITGATGLIGFRVLLMALEAGHHVRFTARSEAKAQSVSSNPAVLELSPGDRLTSVIIPDMTVEGAFDAAVEGVTHIIHVGSPVAKPDFHPETAIFWPTLKMSANLLSSAHKSPTVRRVVITSSLVGVLGFDLPTDPVPTAATRAHLAEPDLTHFDEVFKAYITAKVRQLREIEEFIDTNKPAFTVANIVPGYVFGRHRLVLEPDILRGDSSSDTFLMMAITGGKLPFPIHGGYVHIEDAAEVHLRVALLDPPAEGHKMQDFGMVTKITHNEAFDIVKEAFPKATAEGVFKQGDVPSLPVEFDSSETEQLLGRKLRSFREGVVDAAGQYLELLGKEKA